MFRGNHWSSIHSFKHLLNSVVLILVILWGLRVIAIEGFILASPRNWAGDFSTAFYDPFYWEDDGYTYGPVFTLIKLISNEFPDLFQIELFAASCVLIFIATLVIMWKIFETQKLKSVEKLSIFVLVCTFSPLYYAFSVSAFPEFLELMLIALSFYLLKKNYFKSSMVILGVAAMVKIVPIIVFPFLIPIVGLSGLAVFFATIFFSLSFLVIYLDINYLEAFIKVFEIVVSGSGKFYNPESTEHYGLGSALGRIEIYSLSAESLALITTFLIAATYALAYISSQLFSREFSRERYLEFILVLTTALIPFVSAATHRHSFIFLLPLVFFIVKLRDVQVRILFMVSFLLISVPIYSIFHLKFVVIRYVYHEPVIVNFVILLLMISVAFLSKKRLI